MIRRRLILLILLPPLVVVSYIFGILWRVSLAESRLFGRSDLVPLSLKPPRCTEPGTPESYNERTYSFVQSGKTIHVYEQLINSFQHVYGSALVSLELGEVAADLLFRGNEYFEAVCWRNSGTKEFYLDTKKDLGNNAIGRRIGQDSAKQHLSGREADRFIVSEVLRSLENGTIYIHYNDARVGRLPTLQQFGCPLLSQVQQFRGWGKSPTFE